MKRGSKELYELLKNFETAAKSGISGNYLYDFDRYKPELGETAIPGQFYNNGVTNAAFNAYVAGYQYAKHLARTSSLALED
jgi:hypothetical protein